MSREIRIFVTLTVSDNITDDNDMQELVDNVCNSLTTTANEIGLTPDGYDGMLEHIHVDEQFSGARAITSF